MLLAGFVGAAAASVMIAQVNQPTDEQKRLASLNQAELRKKEDDRMAMTTGQYGSDADIVQVRHTAVKVEEDVDLFGARFVWLTLPSGGKFRSYDVDFRKVSPFV